MSGQCLVSVVISTYNRCDLLPGALEAALSQQTGARYEVIVVDNNSTDRTREVVDSFMAYGAPRLRYVFEGRQGLSHGRNAGIANASGAFIAFTDDDVRVATDWVENIARGLNEHPEADFVGGKILPHWDRQPPRWLTAEHWSPLALADHGDEPFYVNASRGLCLVGASLAFRREVFDRIGLFSEDFQRIKDGVGSVEDHELQLRLWAAGGQGMYIPDIMVSAEVQAERLEKTYHRRWYSGHGRYLAMMRLSEESINVTRLFGTPAYVYRMLLPLFGAWLRATLRRRTDLAFRAELEMRQLVSYIRTSYEQNAGERDGSAAAELVSFATAMLRKKARGN